MMMKTLITTSLVSLLLSACGGNEPAKESTQLTGTKWRLISLNRSKPIGNRPITIAFDGYQVSGNSGCNRYGGTLKRSGRSFNADLSGGKGKGIEKGVGFFSTKMYCPQPRGLMDQEKAYLAQLQESRRVIVEGNQLIIKDGADALVYQRIE